MGGGLNLQSITYPKSHLQTSLTRIWKLSFQHVNFGEQTQTIAILPRDADSSEPRISKRDHLREVRGSPYTLMQESGSLSGPLVGLSC